MLHAFAHRVDTRIEGLQGVADHHAALAVQPGGFRQGDIRTDTDRHHHQVRFDLAAVAEAHTGYPFLAEDGLGLPGHEKTEAAGFQLTLQQPRSHRVQLPLHERVEQVHDTDLHPLLEKAVGGLQPQQAATDDHRPAILT